MKLTLHFRTCILMLLMGYCTDCFAQEVKTFETVREYLDLTHNLFGIEPHDVYYVAESASASPRKVSALMFFRDGEMAVIEDVTEAMKNYCPPDKMIQKVTPDAINKCMFKDPLASTKFTHMTTGKVFKPAKGEMVAVFLLGHELGDAGQVYIKERQDLEANLGIKTLIVTVDENYITEIVKKKNND